MINVLAEFTYEILTNGWIGFIEKLGDYVIYVQEKNPKLGKIFACKVRIIGKVQNKNRQKYLITFSVNFFCH